MSSTHHSIQSAIQAVHAQRVYPRARPASIVLHPEKSSKCHIPIRHCAHCPGIILGTESSNLSISTAVNSTIAACTYTVVSLYSDNLTPHSKALIQLDSAHRITLRRLRFNVNMSTMALSIVNSTLVKLERCRLKLEGPWAGVHALEIVSSQFVFLSRLTVQPERRNPVWPGNEWHRVNEMLTPIVVIEKPLGNFTRVHVHEMTAQDESWIVGNEETNSTLLLNATMSRFKSFRDNRTLGPPADGCLPLRLGVAFIQCSINGLGIVPPTLAQVTIKMRYHKGSGVQFSISPAIGPYVAFIKNSNIKHTRSPEGSAVNIHFNSGQPGNSTSSPSSPSMQLSCNTRHHIVISGCNFLQNRGMAGGALSVKFDDAVAGNSVLVKDCLFHNNSASQVGGAVLIHFSQYSQRRNAVMIDKCRFLENWVSSRLSNQRSPGGAVMAISGQYGSFTSAPDLGKDVWLGANHLYPLAIVNSSFLKNSGFGAVCSRAVHTGFLGTTLVHGTCGTGLVALAAKLELEGNVSITDNVGLNGGGLHIAAGGKMDFRKVVHFTLKRNNALTHGGAMYFDAASSLTPHDKFLFFIGNDHNRSSCPIQFPSYISPHASSAWDILNQNGASRDAQFDFWQCPGPKQSIPAGISILPYEQKESIYSSSWNHCFGTLAVTKHSARGRSLDYTERLYCPPYPPADWSFANPPSPPGLQGHGSLHEQCKDRKEAYSSLGPASNWSFVDQNQVCYSRCQRITVVNGLNLLTRNVKMAPAWMFFKSSSTRCYKTLADRIWHFSKACKRESIVAKAFRNRIGRFQRYDCSILSLALIRDRYRHAVAPTLPGYNLTLTPWSSTLYEWDDFSLEDLKRNKYYGHEDFASACSPSKNITIDKGTELGDLTLHPAPGEQFTLNIDVTDEFMRTLSGPMGVLVQEDHALLSKDRHVSLPTTMVYYASTAELKGLSISGVPGSTGHLQIEYLGKTTSESLNDREFKILLPFKLRDCPPTFLPQQIPEEYVAKQAIRNASSDLSSLEQVRDQLSCRCPNTLETFKDAIRKCEKGRSMNVLRGYWAGMFDLQSPKLQQRDCTRNYESERFLNGTGDPCQVLKSHQVFVMGPCWNGFCYKAGDASHWSLNKPEPCRRNTHRTGVLCTQCKQDYQVMIGTEICRNCKGKTVITLAMYFPLLLLLTAVVFIFLLVFNIGLSPTLNSWLFFIEVVFTISAEAHTMRTLLFSILSLGLGQLCTLEQLTPLWAKVVLLAHPLFMFLFAALTWWAIRTGYWAKHLQRLQKRNSLAHVVWFCIIYCSSSLAYICGSLLNNVELIGIQNQSYTVMFHDGTIQLFSKEHGPFAAFAIVILLVFVMPPPIIMAVPWLRSLPQFKWYADEAMKMYEDGPHWWASVDLVRRLLLACLVGAINSLRFRQYLVALVCVICLVLHVAFRPLKRNKKIWRLADADNWFETLLLSLVSFISVAKVGSRCSGWPKFLSSANFMPTVYAVIISSVTVLAAAVSAYHFIQHWRLQSGKKPFYRRYTVDEDDEENERQAEIARRPLSNITATSICSTRDLIGPRGHDKPIPMDHQPIADGLRHPLLLEHLMRSDRMEYEESQ
ncbi:uncharacterized protein LOC135808620 [Sycon ciliatum]|uniref:uncharacterized protein LOC135808620 n=1 Tax=Sycon ciliatum TaxID=27933 RepID=UPI0031F6C97C